MAHSEAQRTAKIFRRTWEEIARHRNVTALAILGLIVGAILLQNQNALLALRGQNPLLRAYLRSHDDVEVDSLAFQPSRDNAPQRLVSADHQGQIRLWDADTGAVIESFPPVHHRKIDNLAFNKDGSLLASGSEDGTVALWDATRQKRQPLWKEQSIHGGVSSLALSMDGKRMACGCNNGAILLWDLAATPPRRYVLRKRRNQRTPSVAVSSLAFSPDGSLLASDGGDPIRQSGRHGYPILLWDVALPNHRRLIPQRPSSEYKISSLVFSHKGKGGYLASADEGGVIILWRILASPPYLQNYGRLSNRHESIWDIKFNPDDTILAFAGAKGVVRLCDVAQRRQIDPPLLGHHGEVNCIDFSPDGKTLASGGDDGTVILWDLTRREPRP